MQIVRAPSMDSRMSEATLVIMRAKLGVIRALCAPVAKGLYHRLPALEEETARTSLALFEYMLFAMSPSERAEFGHILAVLPRHDDVVLDTAFRDAITLPEMLGVGQQLIIETHEQMRARQEQATDRKNAGLFLTRRLGQFCSFGLYLLDRKRRRPHLQLVRSRSE